MKGSLRLGMSLISTCVVSGPNPDRDLDAIEAWERHIYSHEANPFGELSDTSSGSGRDLNL